MTPYSTKNVLFGKHIQVIPPKSFEEQVQQEFSLVLPVPIHSLILP